MSTTKIKENKKSVIRSGLSLSLPFVLCTVALILISVWLFKGVVEKNSFYKLFINANGLPYQNGGILDGRLDTENIAPDPEWTDDVLASEDEKIEYPAVMPSLRYGQKWGTYNVERFEYYDRPIYNCDNPKIFGYGVGRAFYGFLPGQGKNVVLCAHCTNSFYGLESLRIGDVIKIKTIYGVFEYEVVKRVVFEPTDTSYVLAKYDEEMLTCYTCYPYYTTMPRTQRFAVISKKISGPDYRYDASTGLWCLVGDGQ